MVGDRTKVKTMLFSGSAAKCPEATPVKVPLPDRAGPRSTPAVMLQTFGLTNGDEEMVYRYENPRESRPGSVRRPA
jgi:hypothetical protein